MSKTISDYHTMQRALTSTECQKLYVQEQKRGFQQYLWGKYRPHPQGDELYSIVVDGVGEGIEKEAQLCYALVTQQKQQRRTSL